ncbi:MAG: hypothetical protein JJE55_06155 [Flavobacteriaceae bacterium]|nr:hypothetical protein [Flavobacteriaceae bacterium]
MASLIYNVLLLAIQVASGTQGPPPPAGKGGTRAPGTPIDENIWILLAIGILFGLYILYKRNRATNKAS